MTVCDRVGLRLSLRSFTGETGRHEHFLFVLVAMCFCLLVYFDAYLDPKSKTDVLNVCPIMSEVCAARLSALFSL